MVQQLSEAAFTFSETVLVSRYNDVPLQKVTCRCYVPTNHTNNPGPTVHTGRLAELIAMNDC